jgi:hypothetical protein
LAVGPKLLGAAALFTTVCFLVPGGGLEPPRPCGLRILSPLRLPISPSGLRTGYQLNLKSNAADPHDRN